MFLVIQCFLSFEFLGSYVFRLMDLHYWVSRPCLTKISYLSNFIIFWYFRFKIICPLNVFTFFNSQMREKNEILASSLVFSFHFFVFIFIFIFNYVVFLILCIFSLFFVFLCLTHFYSWNKKKATLVRNLRKVINWGCKFKIL